MALETRRCYFTFGRFQPPTTGHEANFDAVKKSAGSDDYRIYISQTNDTKGTNPLSPSDKLGYMKKMFPKHKGNIHSGPRDPVKCLQDIMLAGYDEVIFLVGSDRVNAMQFLHKYNGKDGEFAFPVSGTKRRRAAHKGDFKAFRAGIPKSLSDLDCANLMQSISDNLPKNFK